MNVHEYDHSDKTLQLTDAVISSVDGDGITIHAYLHKSHIVVSFTSKEIQELHEQMLGWRLIRIMESTEGR